MPSRSRGRKPYPIILFYCYLYIFFILSAVGEASFESFDVNSCEEANISSAWLSLLPDCDKARAMQRYWERKGGIFYWHIQKCGGTTMCQMAVMQGLYEPQFFDGYAQGAQLAMHKLVGSNCAWGYEDPATAMARGRYFFAQEPAKGKGWQCFKRWMESDRFKNASDPFWTDFVHVISVRDPAERFFSDVNMRNITARCAREGYNTGRCLDLLLDPAGRDDLSRRFRAQHAFRGQTRPDILWTLEASVAGNAICLVLGGSADDGAAASRNLKRMSLVLDFKGRPGASAFLLKRVLGIDARGADGRPVRARYHDDAPTFQQLHPAEYARTTAALATDVKVWEEALALIDVHAARLGFVERESELEGGEEEGELEGVMEAAELVGKGLMASFGGTADEAAALRDRQQHPPPEPRPSSGNVGGGVEDDVAGGDGGGGDNRSHDEGAAA